MCEMGSVKGSGSFLTPHHALVRSPLQPARATLGSTHRMEARWPACPDSTCRTFRSTSCSAATIGSLASLVLPTTRTIGRSCMKPHASTDRKSTRLNSSHVKISYAVFCLKKKKQKPENQDIAEN